jgi:hypothetical protein
VACMDAGSRKQQKKKYISCFFCCRRMLIWAVDQKTIHLVRKGKKKVRNRQSSASRIPHAQLLRCQVTKSLLREY